MKLVMVMLVCAGLFLTTSSPAQGQQTAAVVRQVSHATAADGTERIQVSLSAAQMPSIFMIDGDKPRLVLDFPDSGYGGKPSIPVAKATLVRSIRVGIHSAPQRKTRVVVDLAPGSKAGWSKEYLADKQLLVISLSAAGPGAARNVAPAPVPGPAPVSAPVSESASVPAPPPVATASALTPVTAPAPVPVPPSPPVLLSAKVTKIKAPLPPPSAASEKIGQKGNTPSSAAPAAESAADAAGGKKPEPSAGQRATIPVLIDVSFDNAFSQSGEMVLLKLNDFEPPKISTREKDPPRIFCDFARAVIGKGVGGVLHAGGKFIKDIRISQEEKGARVTLELVAGYNYDLQQVFFKEDNLFVLIVNSRKPEKEEAKPSP